MNGEEEKKDASVARALRTTHRPRVLARPTNPANAEREAWFTALQRAEFAFFVGVGERK